MITTVTRIQLILTLAGAGLALPAISAEDATQEAVQERRLPRWWPHRRATEQETTRSVERTEDGREGSSESGKSWTTDRSGSATQNDDGSRTVSREFETTLGNGETISGTKDTTVTRTDDGREWETTGSRSGPRGTSTRTAGGTATRTTDGIDATVERSGTTAGGRDWTATSERRTRAPDDGRVRRSVTRGTTEDGTRFGAGSRSKTTRDGNTIRNKTQRTGRARRNASS